MNVWQYENVIASIKANRAKTESNSITPEDVFDNMLGVAGSLMVEGTYEEILTLSFNNDLVAGMQYRITDYYPVGRSLPQGNDVQYTDVITADFYKLTFEGQIVENRHLTREDYFDIILTATSNSNFSEDARIDSPLIDNPEGLNIFSKDTFVPQYLRQIKIKYIPYLKDKDLSEVSQFADRDPDTEIHGIITYMEDPYGNSAPFDFLGFVFRRYEIMDENVKNGLGRDWGVKGHEGYAVDENVWQWFTLFSSFDELGYVVNPFVPNLNIDDEAGYVPPIISNNKIHPQYFTGSVYPMIAASDVVFILNNNSEGCFNNDIYSTFGITIGASFNNIIRENCTNIDLGGGESQDEYCSYNTFGDNCQQILLFKGSKKNVFSGNNEHIYPINNSQGGFIMLSTFGEYVKYISNAANIIGCSFEPFFGDTITDNENYIVLENDATLLNFKEVKGNNVSTQEANVTFALSELLGYGDIYLYALQEQDLFGLQLNYYAVETNRQVVEMRTQIITQE